MLYTDSKEEIRDRLEKNKVPYDYGLENGTTKLKYGTYPPPAAAATLDGQRRQVPNTSRSRTETAAGISVVFIRRYSARLYYIAISIKTICIRRGRAPVHYIVVETV